MKNDITKILIAGDIMPTPNNENLFNNGNFEKLLGKKLNDIWNGADFRIANLETPITDSKNKILKHGKHIKNSTKVLSGLKSLNLSVLGCANNHILDYGQQGLSDTVKYLEDNKINHGGIVNNVDDYKNFFKLQNNKITIGIYFCCDMDVSCATKDTAGSIPFDCYKTMEAISEIKEEVDFLIVLHHAGVEFFPYPTPLLQKDCKAMVKAGADVVVCQHNHCVSCFENYLDSHIIYGQGHFISCLSDDPRLQDELIIELEISKTDIHINYIPVTVTENYTIQLANDKDAKRILAGFNERSKEIRDGQLNEKFNEYVKAVDINYLLCLRGYRLIDRLLVKIAPNLWKKRCFSKDTLLTLYNYTHSKTHFEVLHNIIERTKEKLC